MRQRLRLSAAVAAALVLTGCAPDVGASAAGAPSTASSLAGELSIAAAASLGTAFDEIAAAFEAAHPGVDVRPVSYDGSSRLATQIVEGAPIDVFASADEMSMATVIDAGLATDAALFATNTLVIVVPRGNPAGIERLADLAGDVTVVLCAPDVPCGAASQTLLAAAGVAVAAASYEQNVTAVLTKVAADEADAGLVYATDVIGRSEVDEIVPEGAEDVVNRYAIAALTRAGNPAAAAAFVSFVSSGTGREILAENGFGAP